MDHHQACVRMVRADYCGDGRSWTVNGRRVNLSVNARDCVGCGVCLARCQPKIFEMCNDKSFISVRRLAACTLCRECETHCPIQVVHLSVGPVEKAAAGESRTPAAAEPKP